MPIGVDNVAHLEQSRELARDLNQVTGKQIFPIPEALVGRVGKLVGTDGNPKMGKSLGNTIFLSDSEEEVERKVMGMFTDPNRTSADVPGKVEGNPVFVYLDAFGTERDKVIIEDFKERYKTGKIGDIEIKKYLVGVLNNFLDPIRKRRAEYERQPELVDQIIKEGTQKTRNEVIKTLNEVKEAINLNSFIDN